MKKIILIIAIALTPFLTNAQIPAFEKYDDNTDVRKIQVFESSFRIGSRIGRTVDEAKEFLDLVKGIKGVKVYMTEDNRIASDMVKTVISYSKSASLSELFRVQDKDGNVRVYVKEGKRNDGHIKELVMVVNGFDSKIEVKGQNVEALIFTLIGDIDLDKISEIAGALNINGAEHLKKAKQ
ncbi:MAG: hypothetical protein COA67_04215 [Lutibacter sp.]|nr:MAG: hypothetical protein COA67_04215 [Lutibacter sp.]